MKPGGTTTCTKPGTGSGECGAGIAANAQLAFTEAYASGSQALTQTVEYEKSSWAKAGIQMTLKAQTFDQVIGIGHAVQARPSCTWEFANWGGGWIYAPDYLPDR